MKTRVLTILLLCLIGHATIFAQNKFQGKVINQKGEALSFVNVVLLNDKDSTYLAGCTTNEKGLFELPTTLNGILKISHLGYVSQFINNPSHENLSITLATGDIKLNDVVVESSKPITRIEGDALVTKVKGTILEKMGSAKDVLGLLPGVMNNQGSIEVFGKGRPAFYINGRLIRNLRELDQLKSNKISQVEVVTTPGARYDATISSVIRITVEKNQGEGFSFDNKTILGYKDYLYGNEEISLNYRKDKLDIFGMLGYAKNKIKGNSLNVQNSWLSTHYMQDVSLTSKSTSQILNGQLGFAYSASPKHSFGMYYKASQNKGDTQSTFDAASWIDKVLSENYLIDQNKDKTVTEHLIDGYYSGKFGQWTLDALFNALWKNNDEDELSLEMNGDLKDRSITISNNVDSRMFAGEVHLSRPLWKGRLKFGTAYTNSRRDDEYHNVESLIDNSDDRIDETNATFYVETSQRFGKMTLQAGVRYEHIDSKYFEGNQKVSEQSRSYDNFFPSASLVFPVNKSIFQLSYSKKYNRPLYSQLSSKISYVNRYLYQGGNPWLQTSYTENLSFNYKYSWFMLMANYSHVEGKIITSCMQYPNNNTITILKNENSPYALDNLQVMASLAPSFGKRYYPALSFGIMSQFYTVDYCDKKIKLNDPVGIIRFNNILALSKGYLFNLDFSWRSKGHSENIKMGQTWHLNLGMTKTFNKHWNLKLSVNDIFNTAKTNTYTTYSDIRDIYIKKEVNTRGIECTLRYNFNTTKSNYKGKGAGNTEKKRL